MRNDFVNALYDMAKEDKSIALITGDLGYGVLTKFWTDFPDQFINAGICEQNMTSVATGIALEGNCVYTYSIANFPTLRCIEQIRNDACYHEANVNIVSVGAGFAYGYLGMSHHATEDIAVMRALPNMVVFTPADPIEAICATKLSRDIKHPCYIRLGKGREETLFSKDTEFEVGKATKLCDGNDTAILCVGAITGQAVKASDMLKKKGINAAVYSFFTAKPIDEQLVLKLSSEMDTVYTLEEHNIVGGFGSAVCETASSIKNSSRIVRLGIEDTYVSAVGTQDYLRKQCKIDAENIADRIYKDLGK